MENPARDDQPTLTPEQAHDAWRGEMVNKGWHYGPVLDEAKKQDPRMVPLAQLPAGTESPGHIAAPAPGEPAAEPETPEADEAVPAHVFNAAHAAHEANRQYCQSIGDDSQPAWIDAPQWQRASEFAGVQAIIDNPDLTPDQSHQGWLRKKEETGWKYGPVKDVDKKEHPYMRPYAELPEDHRAKAVIFGKTVRQVLAAE